MKKKIVFKLLDLMLKVTCLVIGLKLADKLVG